jgi:peptide/nickel transport system substrate-binding protein
MKSKAVVRGVTLAVAAALTLSACSSDSDSSSSGGGDASSDRSGTLNLATSTPPGDFRIGAWTGGEGYMFLSVYDTLVITDPDGNIAPSAAESWSYDETNTKLTFDIRDGMTFTDGTPVDGPAVAASLEASRTGVTTSQGLTDVTAVEAPDEDTVVITLDAPNPGFLTTLTSVGGAIGATASLDDPAAQLAPVGSGAYVLDQEETVVGSTYVLKRNDDNWNAEAYPYETVRFQVITDPTAVLNALQSGQIDFAGIRAEQAEALDENQFTIGETSPQAVLGFWIVDREGEVVPALGDVRVRQAINLALDRETLVEALGAGVLKPTNQIFDPRGDTYSEELYEAQEFDLDAARDLMEEAGHADGFDITMPGVAGLTTQFESGLAQQLGEIGINVTYEPVSFQDVYAKAGAGNYGMFFLVNGFTGSDASDLTANLTAVFNPFDTQSPELDQLIDAAYSAPEDEQDAAFQAINEFLVEQGWYAPIGYATGMYAAAKDIEFTAPYAPASSLRPFQPAGSN